MTTDCKQQSVVHFLSTFLPYTQPLVSLQSTSIPCFMHGDPALYSVVLCYVLFPDKDQTGWQVVCIYAAFKRRCMASFWLLLHKNNLDLRMLPTVDWGRKRPQASVYICGQNCTQWGLGGLTVFEDLTDSLENQHVFLSLLQNLKSKISEKSGQNWSCNKLKTNSISRTQPASQIWRLSSQEGQNCGNFSFCPIFLKF